MNAPQSPPISLNNKDKDTQNLNGKKVAVLHTQVIREMTPQLPEPQPPEAVDYAKILANARVKPTDKIDEAPIYLTIEKEGTVSIIGTEGNISAVTGRAKAKKTFIVSVAVAAAVAGISVLNKIKGTLPNEKKTVLLFDTEQSKHHVLKVVRRICRLCGIDDPPNLEVYSLRPYAPNDRLKVIDYAIKQTAELGLVIIDGIRDLAVDPILDSEQASHIITHLLQWTDQLNIHIMCV
uniref:AAA family ATPase n=1 Tax=Spirosoma sp. TaxID=1899569 RepID=UPI003B39FE96